MNNVGAWSEVDRCVMCGEVVPEGIDVCPICRKNVMKPKANSTDFHSLLNEMSKTFDIKNQKYGNSFETSLDKYGIIAALTRISDKFNRAENLILTNDAGTDDESLTDTLLDMANYCVMTAVYIKNGGAENGKTK